MTHCIRRLLSMTAVLCLTASCSSTTQLDAQQRDRPPSVQTGQDVGLVIDTDHNNKQVVDAAYEQQQAAVSRQHFRLLIHTISYDQLLREVVATNPAINEELGLPVVPTYGDNYAGFVTGGGEFALDQSDLVWRMSAKVPISGPKGSGVMVFNFDSLNRSTEVVRNAEFIFSRTGKCVVLIKSDEPKTFTSGNQP